MVKVLEVDVARKRISLSIKQTEEPQAKQQRPPQRLQTGSRQAPRPETTDMNQALLQLKKKFGK
jgi:uncharacterized protein